MLNLKVSYSIVLGKLAIVKTGFDLLKSTFLFCFFHYPFFLPFVFIIITYNFVDPTSSRAFRIISPVSLLRHRRAWGNTHCHAQVLPGLGYFFARANESGSEPKPGARGWRKTARLGAAEDRGRCKRMELLPLLYYARYLFCHSACFVRLFKTAKRKMPARGKAE